MTMGNARETETKEFGNLLFYAYKFEWPLSFMLGSRQSLIAWKGAIKDAQKNKRGHQRMSEP